MVKYHRTTPKCTV